MDDNVKNKSPHRLFDEIDYSIFVALLAASTFIGIYVAYCSKKRPNTTMEYLVGDRKIGLFPISMSLASSVISVGTFLAVSTDIYKYGTQLLMACVTVVLGCFCMATVFAPILYELNMISSYEYFKIRFNNNVRTFGSSLFLVNMLAFLAVNIYGSCIALAQVSGFDVKVLIPCISIVCIFYTAIGGLRAVVWADTLQMTLMVVGAFSVIIIGVYQAGGLENTWRINQKSGRIIFFEMSFDPSIRYHFWDVVFGLFFSYLSYLLVTQSVTQRCLSLPSLQKANVAIFIFCTIVIMLNVVSGITALAAYVVFQDCDPLTSKIISRDDQIIPYFMMTITEKIPAVPGIFISAIFSASLSSVSTGLNSMAGVILIDFIRPFWKSPIPEARETFIMKISVFISGIVFIALVYLADLLGNIFQVHHLSFSNVISISHHANFVPEIKNNFYTIISLQAIFQGALLGIFTLGMLFPWANSTGALAGGSAAVGLIAWMCIGAQVNRKQISKFKTLLSIDGCDNTTLNNFYSYLNSSKITKQITDTNQDEVFPLYKVPYFYYNAIALLTVLVIGLLVSYFTGLNNPREMNPKLFPTVIRKFCGIKNGIRSSENIKLMKRDFETQEVPL